jgi:predicted dehydrogenase
MHKILIVGLGSIGLKHLVVIRKCLPRVKIMALSKSVDPNNMPTGLDGVLRSQLDAIGFAPDLTIIANPASFHISTAMEFAKINSHLLIEKPISDSPKEVKDLISECERRQLKLQVGYNLRFFPSLQKFKNELQNNKIGSTYIVQSEVGQYLPDWRPRADYKTSVSAQKRLGGGVLLELSHEIDYITWIFGQPKWVSGYITKVSNLKIDVNDVALINFGMENGSIINLNLNFLRHDPKRICEVICENGILKWDGIEQSTTYFERTSRKWKNLHKKKYHFNDSYERQFLSFLASIDTNTLCTDLGATGYDGLRTLDIVSSIEKSDKLNGERVSIEYT